MDEALYTAVSVFLSVSGTIAFAVSFGLLAQWAKISSPNKTWHYWLLYVAAAFMFLTAFVRLYARIAFPGEPATLAESEERQLWITLLLLSQSVSFGFAAVGIASQRQKIRWLSKTAQAHKPKKIAKG